MPQNVAFALHEVVDSSAIYDVLLLQLIQEINEGEAIDLQVHRNLTQAETVGMMGEDFNNLFFHCDYLFFFCTLIIAHLDLFVKHYFKKITVPTKRPIEHANAIPMIPNSIV
jgi:hypothetical protein